MVGSLSLSLSSFSWLSSQQLLLLEEENQGRQRRDSRKVRSRNPLGRDAVRPPGKEGWEGESIYPAVCRGGSSSRTFQGRKVGDSQALSSARSEPCFLLRPTSRWLLGKPSGSHGPTLFFTCLSVTAHRKSSQMTMCALSAVAGSARNATPRALCPRRRASRLTCGKGLDVAPLGPGLLSGGPPELLPELSRGALWLSMSLNPTFFLLPISLEKSPE